VQHARACAARVLPGTKDVRLSRNDAVEQEITEITEQWPEVKMDHLPATATTRCMVRYSGWPKCLNFPPLFSLFPSFQLRDPG